MKNTILAAISLALFLWVPLSFSMETDVVDVHTQSNYGDVFVTHMSMHLSLQMEENKFAGYVDLLIDNTKKAAELALDTKALEITKTQISSDVKNEVFRDVKFKLGDDHKVLGQKLSIPIENNTKVVRIHYATAKNSTGIDWKDEKLTNDGFPMVTTQFQAINARTFVPCQDTPAKKITYDAQIKLNSKVSDSRMRVIMAADKRNFVGNNTFEFSMTKKIPTYLIALAAGVFEERDISERVKVIAEPSMVEKAAREFADAEKMVQAAEELFGAYDWERFDIFIMPNSFSYGGMENPTMTFIGPTVVAGDKSLVDVIAHELAHSWSGNLVTNTTWNDFWINEGTTMYVERKIVEKLYGKKLKDLDIVLGQQVLLDDIARVTKDDGPALTKLHLQLSRDFDPDDAVSFIPYEKGYNFWLALEQAYGEEAVLGFLKKMFKDYAFGSMDTKKLHGLLKKEQAFEGLSKVDVDNWLYGEGLPKAGLPKVESQAINEANVVIKAFSSKDFAVSSAQNLDTKQWSYVLRTVKKIDHESAIKLDKQFSLSEKNDEVRSNFFELAIRSGAYSNFKGQIDEYLGRVGRVKYVKPLYIALKEMELIPEAKALFEKNKDKNNHITNGAVSRNLGF